MVNHLCLSNMILPNLMASFCGVDKTRLIQFDISLWNAFQPALAQVILLVNI